MIFHLHERDRPQNCLGRKKRIQYYCERAFLEIFEPEVVVRGEAVLPSSLYISSREVVPDLEQVFKLKNK